MKFVSLLAFYIHGQWLSSVPWILVSGYIPLQLSHDVCIVCGSPSWVALRLEIHINGEAVWGEAICVKPITHGACSHESRSGEAWRFKSIPWATT